MLVKHIAYQGVWKVQRVTPYGALAVKVLNGTGTLPIGVTAQAFHPADMTPAPDAMRRIRRPVKHKVPSRQRKGERLRALLIDGTFRSAFG